MENRAHALWAGLFVVVFGIAMALSVWWFGGRDAVTRDLILVTQRSVTGLNVQAQVRFRGIPAGKVTDITIDPKDPRNILVYIRVDASLPLTKSTTARLNSQGVTGLAYVQLEDAGKTQELLPHDADPLPRIELQPTLLDTLGDSATDIVGQIAELSVNLNRLLSERNVRHLNRTLDNVAIASDGLKEVPEILASVKMLLSSENLRHLQNTLAHVERTAGETAPLAVELRHLLVALQGNSKRLDDVLGQASGEISHGALPRMNVLLGDLHNNAHQLRRVLDGIEEAPQSVLFGKPPVRPGPGEQGFDASAQGTAPSK